MSTRAYDSSGRRAAAEGRRSNVLVAARRLFGERGYAGTSLADVADAAGVSVPFVRASFGGKAGLLRRLVDVAIVGDEEPVALGQRPEARALASQGAHEQVSGFARIITGVQQRVAGLASVLTEAAGTDSAVREDLARSQRQRRRGMREFVGMLEDAGHLRAGLDPDAATDVVWALTDPRLFVGLCGERRWSVRRYEQFLVDQLAAALLPAPMAAAPGRAGAHE